MLTFRDKQIETFEKKATDRYAERVLAHVERFFPERTDELIEEDALWVVRCGIGRANAHGFFSERDVCKYVTLMFVLGLDFDRDGEFPWAAEILDPTVEREPFFRVDALFEKGVEALRRDPDILARPLRIPDAR